MKTVCMVQYGGIDWSDSCETTEYLKQDGSYNVQDADKVIAERIHQMMMDMYSKTTRADGTIISEVRLVDIPSFDEVLRCIQDNETLEVTSKKDYVLENEWWSELCFSYKDRKVYKDFSGGEITYVVQFFVKEIQDEDVCYLVTEDFLAPVKGVPVVSRFYHEAYTDEAEALEAYEKLELHTAHRSIKALLIMDKKVLPEKLWYLKNLAVVNVLKEHPELDKLENFRIFADAHKEVLEKALLM